MSRTRGNCGITSRRVPWRAGSSVCERGKISYQLANRACLALRIDRLDHALYPERAVIRLLHQCAGLDPEQDLDLPGLIRVIEIGENIGEPAPSDRP